MSAIQKIGKDGVAITLKEITDLIGADHSKAMKKIEKLSQEPFFGHLAKIATPTFNPDGSVNRNIDTYLLTGKQAIAAGVKLNNKMLMLVVDRLEELEAEKLASQQLKALREYAQAEEDKEPLMSVDKEAKHEQITY